MMTYRDSVLRALALAVNMAVVSILRTEVIVSDSCTAP